MYAKFSPSLARGVATAVLLLVASNHCATYESTSPGVIGDGSAGNGGAGGVSTMGGEPGAGGTLAASGSTSGTTAGGQQNGGSIGVAGTSSGSSGGGAAGTGGGAPSVGGQPASGGMAGKGGMGGMPGTAGLGGVAGMGGMGGMGGMAGMAGMGGMGVPVLLSQGKTITADSEQTSQNHLATHANDGSTTTRWCAANNGLNHYLKVDLGQARTLTKVHLLWEKDAAYLFKIETSTDDDQWSMAIDKTASSDASASQDHAMPANTSGRYVRLTVTGGLATSTWASLYEAQIFGY